MKIKSIYSIIFILLFIGCDSKPQKAQEIQSINTNYKEAVVNVDQYTLATTTGEKITFEIADDILFSKQLNGKMVLINFWATWCKPCIKEMPSFVELQEKYKDDFIILAVLFDKKQDLKKLNDFIKKHNINFPVTIGEENYVLAKALDDVNMIPESFLYNKEGFFVEKFLGEISKSKLETFIQKDNI
ncbi:TlpA family protein disulfide reductase [Arcobacteraceae bacterium]|nr:TlpA family protein disulfide reductase [Arcobacteraceae bacterium]